MRSFKIIACLDKSGGIGKGNKMAWVSAHEMAHFRSVTMSSIVIMGRLTYESIGRKLPHRENVVISSKSKEELPNADFVFDNLVDAIEFFTTDERNMFVIGGGKLYSEAICLKGCHELILSRMLNDYECDVFFPKIDTTVWLLEKVDTNLQEKADFVVNYYKNVSKINEFDEQYNTLVNNVLKNGVDKSCRNAICRTIFCPPPLTFDLSSGKIPLLTTRKIYWKGIVHELIFFMSGSSDISYLKDNNVHIWDKNVEDFKSHAKFPNDAGRFYSIQYRAFGTEEDSFDQIEYLLQTIRTEPSSRRLMCTAFHPVDHLKYKDRACLLPCHPFFQVSINSNKLDMMVLMRSNDLGCATNMNCVYYVLLTMVLAKATGYTPGRLTFTINDAHIYPDHLKNIKTQINRYSYESPTVEISDRLIGSDLKDLKYDDFTLKNYTYHPSLKYEMTL